MSYSKTSKWILELWHKGYMSHEIVKITGVSRQYVSQVLKANGFSPRKAFAQDSLYAGADVPVRGYSPKTIRVIELYRGGGKTYKQIGGEAELSAASVGTIVKKAFLPDTIRKIKKTRQTKRDEAQRLSAEGYSLAEIAEQLGTTLQKVWDYVIRDAEGYEASLPNEERRQRKEAMAHWLKANGITHKKIIVHRDNQFTVDCCDYETALQFEDQIFCTGAKIKIVFSPQQANGRKIRVMAKIEDLKNAE